MYVIWSVAPSSRSLTVQSSVSDHEIRVQDSPRLNDVVKLVEYLQILEKMALIHTILKPAELNVRYLSW